MNTPEVQSGVEQTGGARRPVRTKPFDPYLGAVCAGTWWDLGKLLAHRADPSWIEKRIRGWVRDLHPQVRPHVSVAAVTTFAETLYGVLARKYLGESIAKEANLLTAPIRSASSTYYNDDGEYLDYIGQRLRPTITTMGSTSITSRVLNCFGRSNTSSSSMTCSDRGTPKAGSIPMAGSMQSRIATSAIVSLLSSARIKFSTKLTVA